MTGKRINLKSSSMVSAFNLLGVAVLTTVIAALVFSKQTVLCYALFPTPLFYISFEMSDNHYYLRIRGNLHSCIQQWKIGWRVLNWAVPVPMVLYVLKGTCQPFTKGIVIRMRRIAVKDYNTKVCKSTETVNISLGSIFSIAMHVTKMHGKWR